MPSSSNPPDPVAHEHPSDHVTFDEVVLFARRQAVRLVLPTLGAALIAVLVLVAIPPPRYQTWATLMVTEADDSRGADNSVVGPDGAMRIAESGGVLQETLRRLGGELASGGSSPDPGLDARIFSRPRVRFPSEAAVLELVVRHQDPAIAARAANLWAEVFVERLDAARAAAAEVALARTSYENAKQELEAAELDMKRQLVEHREALAQARQRWQRDTAAYRRRSQGTVGAFHEETRRRFARRAEEFASAAVDAGGGTEAQSLGLRAALLREQLALTPRFLEPDRGASGGGANPLYETMFLQATEVDLEARRTHPRDVRLGDFLRRLEQLQGERTAALGRLLEERSAGLAALGTAEERELASLEAETKIAAGRATTDLQRTLAALTQSEEGFRHATSPGRQTTVPRVYVVSEAIVPGKPMPGRFTLKIGTAAFLGIMIGLTWALSAERRHLAAETLVAATDAGA